MNYKKYEEIISKHERISQPMICLQFLMEVGVTSAYEIRQKFGFLDPAKQISVLKTAYQIPIYKRRKEVIDRFGRKVHTKEYSLERLDGFTEDYE